jgi:putative ABC transport system permease protein
MRILLQDRRYAIRMLLKNPGFAAVAVLTLALGSGANTAIFSALDSVLLRALPVPNPQELSMLTDPDSDGASFDGEGGEQSLLAYSEFQYLRDHNEVFSHIFAADSQLPDVTVRIGNASANSQAHPENMRVRLVSGDYFDTLGIRAAAGQVFTPEVDRARGAAPIAVISYAFWKQRFGLYPSALDRTIQTPSLSFALAGFLPARSSRPDGGAGL